MDEACRRHWEGVYRRQAPHEVSWYQVEPALDEVRSRLGPAAERVKLLRADVTAFMPDRRYVLWHDRAVFHFLTAAADRRAYVAALTAALRPGGHVRAAAGVPVLLVRGPLAQRG